MLVENSINVRVANSPGNDFDGEAKTTFRVYGISISADRESSKWVSFAEVDMDVTYFRCPTGMFWSAMSSDCDLCTSVHNNGDTVRMDRSKRDFERYVDYENLDRARVHVTLVEPVHFDER